MYKDIFLAATPFQLLNAIEAASFFKDDTPQILILIEGYSSNSIESIQKLLSFYHWNEIRRIKVNDKLGFLKQLYYVSYFKKYKVRHLFIADYQGWYFQVPMALNIKRTGKLFLIDDGAGTIVMQQMYLPEGKIYEYTERQKADKIKKRLLNLFGFKTKFKEKVNVFSIFDLEPFLGQEVIKNDLPVFRSKLKSGSSLKKQSIFIGSSLVDTGHLDEEVYINYIKLSVKELEGPLYYYPHRNESQRILDIIGQIPDLVIHRNKYFIELELIENNILPINIVSFWSTSLFTLNMLFPDAKLYFLKLKEKDVKSGYYNEVDIVYNYYQKNLSLNSIEELA